MAIRPDDAATLAKGVQELYSEAESTLLQRIAAALAKGNDAPDWAETKLLGIQALSRQADGILADLAKNVPGAVERAVGIAYNRGIATAGTDLTAAGLTAGAFGEVQTTGAAAAIVSDTLARLTPMQFQIRRAVTDVYQQVVTQVAAQTVLGTVTRREASAKILTRLAAQGVTGFRDVAGRQWSMSAYAEMAARTSASNAMLQGHTDRIRELGIDTVIVSNAPEECKICRPYEGKVLSLSGNTTGRLRDGKTVVASLSEAKGNGLYHPNCRHSHAVYLPGITKTPSDTADPEGDALRSQQRAHERRVRELKRQDAMAQEFGGPAATQARARLRAKQAEFRNWRETNDRKDLAYRTSIAKPGTLTAPKPAPKLTGFDRWEQGRDINVHQGARPDYNPENPLEFYGTALDLADKSNVTKAHLADLEQFSEPAHRTLRNHFADTPGGGFYVGDKAMPKLDNQGHLAGERPRGWPPGQTWDNVPGGYDPNAKVCACGGGGKGHGATSLALHEASHALDHALVRKFGARASETPEWQDAFYAMHGAANMNPYFTYDGNQSGFLSEGFAESYAAFTKHRALGVTGDLGIRVAEALGVDRLGKPVMSAARGIIAYFEKIEREAMGQ